MNFLFYAGIVIITGLFFGKLVKFIKLPNVTGYLLGGFILGPSIIGIISEDAVHSLSTVSNVALGFIAFSIGSEMKISYFKEVGTRPIVIAIFEALFGVLFVLGSLLLFFTIKGDLTTKNIQFSLVLAAIAAATAPAATLMVIRQYKAKGLLTNTLLSVVAIDDGVAIILFGICVAIANMLGVSSQDVSLFMQILEPIKEIFISLAVGGGIGILLTLASKWYSGRGNRISLVVAAIFMTAYLAKKFDGSELLASMMVGAVYSNLYKKYEEVNGLIYFVTPPIFIMFFVVSGAELKLSLLAAIGLVGVIYVLFRVFGKIFGAWLGARFTKADPKVAKYLGFSLIPQAGVAIGLSRNASLMFSEVGMPDLGTKIITIVLCATLIYELTGPLITKFSLKKAGEITE